MNESTSLTPGTFPDHDECIEQAYFFQRFRERLADNTSAQEVLSRAHEELIMSTRLPYAVQFLATEMKHSGLLANGFAKLPHYFTPFQAFVVKQAENDGLRFTVATALLVLEREAEYKSKSPTPAGLFVYQFEAIARNRLGYDAGLTAMTDDPFYGPEWKAYIEMVRRQGGTIDFCELVYLRSEQYVIDQRRTNPEYVPSLPPIYGPKEGRIAKASRGRDPLFLFAALQRQLEYPEIPRHRGRDDMEGRLQAYDVKIREMESRIRMLESELRGNFDPTQFGKPDILRDTDTEPEA